MAATKYKTVKDYLDQLPAERKEAFEKLRNVIIKNIPPGFKENMQYNMPSFVVPHSTYPDGYHCKPTDALPFVNVANQKGFIALYHMGVYAQPDLYEWFTSEYAKHCKRKLNMGKSCIRFKYMDDIPFDLIGELMTKMTVQEWVALYEKNIKK